MFGIMIIGASDTQFFLHLKILYQAITKVRLRYYTEADFQAHGLDQIQYPVPVEMIPQLEEQLQMSFNLFSFYDNEGRGRYVMFVSKRNMPREIDLLYYDNHYVWIKNFSRLFHDITKKDHQYLFCKRCLSHFLQEEHLNSPPTAMYS